jgi:hypothetical protein
MMAAVLKFVLNRIRQVGVLCGNSIFEASVLRWNTGAQDIANVSKRSRYRCRTLRVELRSRAQGFGTLYNWLSDRDVLIVKADRREPLDLAA